MSDVAAKYLRQEPETNYSTEASQAAIATCVYQPPYGDQPTRYQAINALMQMWMRTVDMYCPPSRERSLAFTKMEEARMWANAAIAKNEREPKA